MKTLQTSWKDCCPVDLNHQATLKELMGKNKFKQNCVNYGTTEAGEDALMFFVFPDLVRPFSLRLPMT